MTLPAVVEAPLPEDEEEAQVHRCSPRCRCQTRSRLRRSAGVSSAPSWFAIPNRVVSTAVLSSPKLTETEVENFARMQNVSEEVLRIIGTSRAVDEDATAWSRRW